MLISKRSAAAFALALVSAWGPAAGAELLSDFAKASLGEWLAVTDDGEPGCRLTLEADCTIGGRVARPAADCAARNPRLADVSAWDEQSGIRLFDPTRKLVLVFEEDETTLLKTRGDAGKAAMLVRAKPGVDRAPFAPALFGTWAMRRPGGPVLCKVTFLDKPPSGGEESFVLRTDASCDAAVQRLKLVSWRIEDFALMLYGSADASLRFEPSAEGFSKAEGGKPLNLVRER